MDPFIRTLIILAVVVVAAVAAWVYAGHVSAKHMRQPIRYHYDPLAMNDPTLNLDTGKYREAVKRQVVVPPELRTIQQLVDESSNGAAARAVDDTGAIAYRHNQRRLS